jgi:hypothetical protein
MENKRIVELEDIRERVDLEIELAQTRKSLNLYKKLHREQRSKAEDSEQKIIDVENHWKNKWCDLIQEYISLEKKYSELKEK